MGAPGPPGGFDAQKYLRTGPYPPQTQPPHRPAPNAFYSQPARPSYPSINVSPNSSVPPKSSSFPPLPGAPNLFNASPVLQGASPALNPYYFVLDPGPPTTVYPPGLPASFQQPQFSQSSSLSTHTPPATSSVLVSTANQDRGLGPVSSSPLDGARLMALLATQSAGESLTNGDEILATVSESPPPTFPDLEVSPTGGNSAPGKAPPMPTAVSSSLLSASLPSTKQDINLPRGRVLKGERATYDVDVRKPGETQPQLEPKSITVYESDPVPILGKQIAVNKNYICYGLQGGAIRIFNQSKSLQALLRGHTYVRHVWALWDSCGPCQRVTDMAFLAEDVNRIASVSKDGRLIVRNLVEGRAADGRPLITEQIVLALQFTSDWNSIHPRICWHKIKQDFLVVAVGKYVVLINVNKVQQGVPQGGFFVEEPVECHLTELLEGITIVGEHEEDVTDLAVPLHISSLIASASRDGLVRIWGEKRIGFLSTFTPHMGEVVGAVAFLTAPDRPEHLVLLTVGLQMNRELKLWAPEGSLSAPKTGTIMWQCIQTVEFESSAAGNDIDDAFFNQVVVAPRASQIVVANAKKNAIYVLHVQFESKPEKTQMQYLSEFSVTMPILSLTVTEESVSEGGEGAVQIYCVQTKAIQQYTLASQRPFLTEKKVKQASTMVKKPAVKVPAATPSPTPNSPLEKVVLKVNNPVADATSVPSLTSAVPPRYERLTAAFENLLDGGQPMSEMAMLIASTKLSASELAKELRDDPKKPAIVSPQVSQTMIEVSQVSTSPGNKAETNLEAPKAADPELLQVPPVKTLSRSKSPTKAVEQRYVPVSAGLAKNQVEKPEEIRQSADKISSPGGLTRQSSGKMEDVSEIKLNVPATTGLGWQASGSFDKASEGMQNVNVSSRLRRQLSGKREEFVTVPEPAQATAALDTSFSFSSNKSGVENSLEDEEQRRPSGISTAGVQTQPGLYPPHLITPSELMSLAGRPKGPEVDSSRPHQADSTKVVGDSLNNLDTRVVTEIEAVQLETVNFPILSANSNDLISGQSEASKGLEVSNVESSEQDSATQLDGPPVRGSTLHHTEDEGSMDVHADDAQEQSRARSSNLGEISGDMLGMSAQGSSVAKGKKNKNKTNGGLAGAGVVTLPVPVQLPVTSTANHPIVPEGEASSSWDSSFLDSGMVAQVALMQDSLNQLINMQNELQKQMTVMVSVPVAKEGKRLEVAMGQRMEKVLKAHVDALWARLAEENAKREKTERERVQQITTLLTNLINKDMPAVLERGLKKEFLALIPAVSQAILAPLQKLISSVITETYQKGIAEKLVPQLERLILGKLEVTISRQLQTQFQSVGKQALQDAIRTSFEGYIIPTFENSCRSMFEHVDSTFQRGMAEHVLKAQHQISAMHSPLASTLQDTVASATALAETLKGDLMESNQRLLTLVENAGTAAARGSNLNEKSGFLEKILSLQHVEETIDPTVKLTKLLKENKYEEAFNMALSLSDVAVVSWLCNQIDPVAVFQSSSLPLSQGVLLSLVQQLGVDIGTDTKGKLRWIQEAVLYLNPKDPGLAPHVRGVLEQLHQSLQRQSAIIGTGELSNHMRLVIHVVNSMLTACK